MKKRYTNSFKIKVVEKALSRSNDETLEHIALHYGIGHSTLSRWLFEVNEGKLVTDSGSETRTRPADWTSEAKLQALVDSDGLDEQETGRYCREKGLYQHHLSQFKEDLMSHSSSKQPPQYKADIRRLKAENKRLQRELTRKDKALAEAAALLILKKKAEILFGLDEAN